MIFLQHGNTVTYQLGWTIPMDANITPISYCCMKPSSFTKRNLAWLDLGTVDSVNNPGLTRFKVRAGATLRPLGGTWIAAPRWRS